MNNYEDWAQLIAKNLKSEADLIATSGQDKPDDSKATQAFIRTALEPFLPETLGIGQGRVIDSAGNYSDYMDIIVYDRDYPRLGVNGMHSTYLFESVLAVFSIRAKLEQETLLDTLHQCASIANLQVNMDELTQAKMARENGLTGDAEQHFMHQDPLSTERFGLLGRPLSFIFGFTGMEQNHKQLRDNIQAWMQQQRDAGADANMKSLPAVIATQGCFAWRNAAPLAPDSQDTFGIGQDSAPIRLIILQLLLLLNHRLGHRHHGGYGIKPGLNSYLSQLSLPDFETNSGQMESGVSEDASTSIEAQDNHDDQNTVAPVKLLHTDQLTDTPKQEQLPEGDDIISVDDLEIDQSPTTPPLSNVKSIRMVHGTTAVNAESSMPMSTIANTATNHEVASKPDSETDSSAPKASLMNSVIPPKPPVDIELFD